MQGPSVPEVYVVAPGANGGYGGIARLVNATLDHWRSADMQPALRLVDPYGNGRARGPRFARAVAQIAGAARRRHIALLHIHVAARGSAARKAIITRLAARFDIPVLLHVHGSRLDEFHDRLPALGRRWLRRLFESADSVVAPGIYWRDVLVEQIGVDPAHVRVIGNAAAGPASLRPRPPRRGCELVFLGNLSSRKGMPELLQALAMPRVAACDWHLQVAGLGDPAPFAAQAAALGIAQRVDFLGWVAEAGVRELLATADVFVLPSHTEGLSIAMLEAMAHACAIVATPVGATLDAVADGESALLVPHGDATALAAALQRLMTDRPLRRALQTSARQRWRAQFDIAHHCRQIAEVYREILERRAASVPVDHRS